MTEDVLVLTMRNLEALRHPLDVPPGVLQGQLHGLQDLLLAGTPRRRRSRGPAGRPDAHLLLDLLLDVDERVQEAQVVAGGTGEADLLLGHVVLQAAAQKGVVGVGAVRGRAQARADRLVLRQELGDVDGGLEALLLGVGLRAGVGGHVVGREAGAGHVHGARGRHGHVMLGLRGEGQVVGGRGGRRQGNVSVGGWGREGLLLHLVELPWQVLGGVEGRGGVARVGPLGGGGHLALPVAATLVAGAKGHPWDCLIHL